jgi:hypothetical protein
MAPWNTNLNSSTRRESNWWTIIDSDERRIQDELIRGLYPTECIQIRVIGRILKLQVPDFRYLLNPVALKKLKHNYTHMGTPEVLCTE